MRATWSPSFPLARNESPRDHVRCVSPLHLHSTQVSKRHCASGEASPENQREPRSVVRGLPEGGRARSSFLCRRWRRRSGLWPWPARRTERRTDGRRARRRRRRRRRQQMHVKSVGAERVPSLPSARSPTTCSGRVRYTDRARSLLFVRFVWSVTRAWARVGI